MLIVCQRDAFFDFGVVLAAVEKDVFDTAWKKIKENPDQFENPDFLENLNQELKKKYAYLIVRKDGMPGNQPQNGL